MVEKIVVGALNTAPRSRRRKTEGRENEHNINIRSRMQRLGRLALTLMGYGNQMKLTPVYVTTDAKTSNANHRETLIANMENAIREFNGTQDTPFNRRCLEEVVQQYVKELVHSGYLVERDYKVYFRYDARTRALSVSVSPELEWVEGEIR